MRIYVIRHGDRADGDVDAENGDMEAALTPEGEKAARALGTWMADKEEIPTVLIASPAARCQETAECIASAIGEAGFVAPEIKTDVGIGPHMSIRAAVIAAAQDPSMVRVGFVSHHESIEHGLRVLNLEPWIHLDQYAMGELRILRVKRKSGRWDEHRRVLPSDLGSSDYY